MRKSGHSTSEGEEEEEEEEGGDNSDNKDSELQILINTELFDNSLMWVWGLLLRKLLPGNALLAWAKWQL